MSSRGLDGGGRFGVDDGVCLWGLTKWIDLFSDIITFLKSSSLSSLPCLRTEDVLGRTPKACWIGNVSPDEPKICMRIETCTGTRTHACTQTQWLWRNQMESCIREFTLINLRILLGHSFFSCCISDFSPLVTCLFEVCPSCILPTSYFKSCYLYSFLIAKISHFNQSFTDLSVSCH